MIEQVNNLLREHNFRITPQRKAIFQILCDCKGHHLEIEKIYKLLVTKGNHNKKIGLATVYRTMEVFEKIGLVSRLSMENLPTKYELILHNKLSHHHLICLSCGKVQEIGDELTEDFKTKVLQDKDFVVTEKPMKIFGYCGQCKMNAKDL